MKGKHKVLGEPHYYSERLKKKLGELRSASAVIVEAPSGYGKTTAVRDYLETSVSQNTPVCWFSAVDEAPASAWRRLCREIDKIDSRAGERLLRIDFPNVVTVGEACDALRSLKCKREAYLVIDNFQLLNDVLPSSLLTALIEHGGSGLHIVILTQMLGKEGHAAVAGHGFLRVTASDLRLDTGDIQEYCALAGTNITPEEAQKASRYTEGWIIAVYLQLCAFRETGFFSDTAVLTLMERLVWGRLTEEQQDFFLHLSAFETVTAQQMCVLMGWDSLPGYALDALDSPFIRYDASEKRYTAHSILHELLTQKCRGRSEAFRRECLLQAGNLCRDDGNFLEALGFYWRVRDYERILSLDFSHFLLEKIEETSFSAIALELAQNCPAEIKKRYPLSMLRVAWALKTAKLDKEFDALLEELHPMTNAPELLGEWLLLSSFQYHPDLRRMAAVLRDAEPLFAGKCSRVIFPHSLWGFGVCGPIALYYTKPGDADREADALEEYMSLYTQLTDGCGCGADVLYRSELAYHRGDLTHAEILAYRAMFLAQSRQQSMVQLGAALQLAQVALHKADAAGWQSAVSSMEHAALPMQDSFAFRAALDTVRGMLFAELTQLDAIADWIKAGDFPRSRLLPAQVPLAIFVHANYLLHKGQFARLIGLIQAQYPDGAPDSPLVNMLLSLTAAAAYLQVGDRANAEKLVLRAGNATLPDGVLFPLASYSFALDGLVDDLVEKEYPGLLERFRETRERFVAGWTKLFSDLNPEQLPEGLTAREREVAVLASQGLRNNEIAERLSVTESTVRTHLRSAFQKLDVDRRAKLADKLK